MSRTFGRGVLAAAALGGAAAVGAGVRALVARRVALQAVAPELRHPALLLPMPVGNATALRVMRRLPVRPAPLVPGVTVERRLVSTVGHPDVPVYVYTSNEAGAQRPSGALLWIHGGGYVLGDPVTYHDVCSRFAAELGIVVVSVDYRLAPENPFPAGLEDCYDALRWMHDHAAELGVDGGRIAVGGDSAGGGLAAALAQLAHDRGEVPIRFQLLVYPMLDDRTVLRTDHAGTGAFVWSPASNRFGWTSYLGRPPSSEEPPPYAAPARREDLAGLPPAWIGVGEIDLFHVEDVTYAERLIAAGVPCELVVVTGMFHGADAVFGGKAPSMVEFRAAMRRAVGTALTPA